MVSSSPGVVSLTLCVEAYNYYLYSLIFLCDSLISMSVSFILYLESIIYSMNSLISLREVSVPRSPDSLISCKESFRTSLGVAKH